MAITTNFYNTVNDEIILVEVAVGGKTITICEETQVEATLQKLGYLK